MSIDLALASATRLSFADSDGTAEIATDRTARIFSFDPSSGGRVDAGKAKGGNQVVFAPVS